MAAMPRLLYSPDCVEGRYPEVGLPLYGVLRNSLPEASKSTRVRDLLLCPTWHEGTLVPRWGKDDALWWTSKNP